MSCLTRIGQQFHFNPNLCLLCKTYVTQLIWLFYLREGLQSRQRSRSCCPYILMIVLWRSLGHCRVIYDVALSIKQLSARVNRACDGVRRTANTILYPYYSLYITMHTFQHNYISGGTRLPWWFMAILIWFYDCQYTDVYQRSTWL